MWLKMDGLGRDVQISEKGKSLEFTDRTNCKLVRFEILFGDPVLVSPEHIKEAVALNVKGRAWLNENVRCGYPGDPSDERLHRMMPFLK
jgi:hypothetical protein